MLLIDNGTALTPVGVVGGVVSIPDRVVADAGEEDADRFPAASKATTV